MSVLLSRDKVILAYSNKENQAILFKKKKRRGIDVVSKLFQNEAD